MIDWIQGDKFKELADYCFAPEIRVNDDYDNMENTFDLCLLRDKSIVYTHSMYIRQFFANLGKTNKTVYLITHNGDVNIDSSFNVPWNIIKWYAQNVNVENPRIRSIPIGLENNRWYKGLHKKEKMEALLTREKKFKNLVYVNHNVKTNPEQRIKPYILLSGKKWCTIETGKNGQNFDAYIANIYDHKFVICPEGNGMDTHRTWECLYLNTIPIEIRNKNNQFYRDLPICFVNSWEEVTEDFLLKEYDRITSMNWNLEKLNFSYWKNKINEH